MAQARLNRLQSVITHHNRTKTPFLLRIRRFSLRSPETALKDDAKQIADNHSRKGANFSLAPVNVRAYQAKLLEIAQANMQFAFEFAQRLATIRSPVEFPSVIAEFTSRRMTMFRKHSTEMAELSTKRIRPAGTAG